MSSDEGSIVGDIIEQNELEEIDAENEHFTEVTETATDPDAQTEDQNEGGDAKPIKPKRVIKNPQPKLNEQTLKTPKGLEALEKCFERVKFKGRGYEEQDLNVIMKTYEYWCHRLFPKFPFDACIDRLEKLGHKRATQTYVKRIRQNLVFDENEIIREDEICVDGFVNVDSNQFDELQSEPASLPSISTPTDLSEEQLEQIRKNKERAEQLRLQKLTSARERGEANLTVSSRLPESSQQTDSSELHTENNSQTKKSRRTYNNVDSDSDEEAEVNSGEELKDLQTAKNNLESPLEINSKDSSANIKDAMVTDMIEDDSESSQTKSRKKYNIIDSESSDDELEMANTSNDTEQHKNKVNGENNVLGNTLDKGEFDNSIANLPESLSENENDMDID